jgi:alpha-tubulin suppressor-like RCC1 family protein
MTTESSSVSNNRRSTTDFLGCLSIVLLSLFATACSTSDEQLAQGDAGTDAGGRAGGGKGGAGGKGGSSGGTSTGTAGDAGGALPMMKIGASCAGSLAGSSGDCAQPATELKLGSSVSCALLGTADVNGAYALSCWGTNADNQLRASGSNRPMQGNLNVSPVRDVGVGGQFMCMLDDASDSITCWGANSLNQLAVKDTSSTENTFTVNGAVAITSGADSSCALTASGSGGKVYCWGNLFNERASSSAYPTRQVTLASTAVEIAGGSVMTCARLSNGQVQCWGLAYQDNGYTVHTVVDGSNATLTGAVQIVASGASGAIAGHACARKSNGEIWCWGYGYYGEIGNDSTGSFSLFPATKVGTISNAIDISVGLTHTCVLVSGGQVSCWGTSKMAIGSGDQSTPISSPTAISGLNDAIDVESGWAQNCARRRSGQVSCWGINLSGELGDGTTSERTTVRNVVGLP